MTKTNTETQETTPLSQEIKVCQPQDLTQIVAFGYKTFKENDLAETHALPEFDKITLNVTDWVLNETCLVKRNDEDEKLIDGCLVLKHGETWWSTQPLLMSTLFYVKPEKRSFKLAKALLDAAKEYAIMEGVPLVIDLFDNKDSERKQKLLELCGFKNYGSVYVYIKD